MFLKWCLMKKCTNTSDPSENLKGELTNLSTPTEVNSNEMHTTDYANESTNNENNTKATEELTDKWHDSVQIVEDQLDTECSTKEQKVIEKSTEKEDKETTE